MAPYLGCSHTRGKGGTPGANGMFEKIACSRWSGRDKEEKIHSTSRICSHTLKILKHDKVSIFFSRLYWVFKRLCSRLCKTTRRGGGRSQDIEPELVCLVLLLE